MEAKRWAIGVDLGGTKIEVARVDQDGSIRHRMRAKTEVSHGYKAVEGQIEAMIQDVMETFEPDKPVGIGVGAPGQIDSTTGNVKFAPNLKWRDVPLGAFLKQQFRLPVIVLNDVRAATWGEWVYGAGKGSDNLICIFVGTGIGGGIVCNGQLLEGASNCAGEVGHMTVQLDGPECHCGNRGCMEALAGSWAIARDARQAVRQDPRAGRTILELAGGDPEAITAKIVTEAYLQGDELAGHLIRRVAEALAAGVVGLVNAVNPEHIILGGGVIGHLPELVSMVDKAARERALGAATVLLKILPARLQDDSGVIGAAAQILDREWGTVTTAQK